MLENARHRHAVNIVSYYIFICGLRARRFSFVIRFPVFRVFASTIHTYTIPFICIHVGSVPLANAVLQFSINVCRNETKRQNKKKIRVAFCCCSIVHHLSGHSYRVKRPFNLPFHSIFAPNDFRIGTVHRIMCCNFSCCTQ